jgi:hypothetical protein
MSTFNPNKLHVKYIGSASPNETDGKRFYTLTHSDQTGDLFLSIGTDYDQKAISGWYTRLMRDEVLAEWRLEKNQPELHVHCHVSGGLVFGSARWRYSIFQHHLRQVLQAFRHGDRPFIEAHQEYDQAPVIIHFHSTKQRYNRIEAHGVVADYR